MSGHEISPDWCRKMARLEEEVGGEIGAGLLAADPDLFGDVEGNAVAQVAHANHAGAEALKLKRDRRQRRLLWDLWRATLALRGWQENFDECHSSPDGEFPRLEDEAESEEAWLEIDQFVATLREHGIDLNRDFDEQLPPNPDAPLPADYWRGAT